MGNNIFLGRDPYKTGIWKEWEIQAFIVQESRRMGLVVHGDQNGSSKTPKGVSMAAVTGALAGWPDLTFLVPDVPVFVELKITGGSVSKPQREVHDYMTTMGYPCHVVYAASPIDGWNKVLEILANLPNFALTRQDLVMVKD